MGTFSHYSKVVISKGRSTLGNTTRKLLNDIIGRTFFWRRWWENVSEELKVGWKQTNINIVFLFSSPSQILGRDSRSILSGSFFYFFLFTLQKIPPSIDSLPAWSALHIHTVLHCLLSSALISISWKTSSTQ